jgi:hypothetical protein
VSVDGHYFAEASRQVSLAEPRIPCPRCGAHVIVSLRVVDRLFMSCPVCELRWAEDNPLHHHAAVSSARE